MNNNSLTVYKEKILPNLKDRHKRVMNALQELGEASQLDVADFLNVPVHSLSGRFSELERDYDRPQIEIVGKKLNRYNNTCSIYRVKVYQPEGEQGQLFEMNNTKLAG